MAALPTFPKNPAPGTRFVTKRGAHYITDGVFWFRTIGGPIKV